MKFRAHETFFIRKGWLSKGMKYVKLRSDVFTAKDEKPMDILGIGSNMVSSLRYWLQAVGLTEEIKGEKGKRIQRLTDLGELIFKYDRYIEESGTLALLQYELAKNKEMATAWWFFFNEFSLSRFTQDDFVTALTAYIKEKGENSEETGGKMPALRALNEDFNCIVGTYLSPQDEKNEKNFLKAAEYNITCPLSELHLLDMEKTSREKSFRKVSAKGVDPYIALSIIVAENEGKEEILLSDLRTKENSISKVLNLDVAALLDILSEIERRGEIKIIRTAGLDVIRLLGAKKSEEYMLMYYKNLDLKRG